MLSCENEFCWEKVGNQTDTLVTASERDKTKRIRDQGSVRDLYGILLLYINKMKIYCNSYWKPHIKSIAKHVSQKLGFLSRARGYFSPSQLLAIYKCQIRPSLEYCSHVWAGAPKSLHLLDRVQSKAIRLISNPNLTNSQQSLSHRRLVADLSIVYRYFHGHCLRKSRVLFLIQWGVFEPPEALPIDTLSKLHYLIHDM